MVHIAIVYIIILPDFIKNVVCNLKVDEQKLII